VRARLTAPQDGTLGLHGHRKDARILFLEKAGHTGKCSTRADAGDEGVHPAFHLLPNLDRRGVVMELWIRLVFELQRRKYIRIVLRQSQCLLNRPLHAFHLRRAHDRRAEAAHQDAFFFRKALGNEEHDSIATVRADEGQTHAGVAGGRLDDRRSWLENAALLRVEDHPQRGAILHAAAGVQELELGVHGRPLRPSDSPQVQHRRLPHQLGDVFSDPQGRSDLLYSA